jgi:hypothetical protein
VLTSTDVASAPGAARGARAAIRAKWQTARATLSAPDSSHGRRQNQPAMDGGRGAHLPLAAGFLLRATEARGGYRVIAFGGV